jgi:ribosomal protein S18 acetylase RimI-like enzyme
MGKIDIGDKATIIHRIEENLWEMWSTFGLGPGCSLYDSKEALWFETTIPIIPYNGVIRFQADDNVDQKIDAIVQHFGRKKAQFMWVLHPTARPSDLGDRLLSRGLIYVEPTPGMARTLDHLPELPPTPDDIDIHKVTGQRDSSAFYEFAAWRWNVPEQYQEQYATIVQGFHFGEPNSKAHMWQAWRAGRPVAKAGLLLASNSAGIYAVVTRPEARRLGLARILTLTTLYEARSRGYQLAVLHSSPMAEGLYRSLGFATYADFLLYASQEVHI